MTERWKVNDQVIEIRRRRYQRTLRLRVTLDGFVRVSCAASVGKREILRFLEESRRFIESQRSEADELRRRYPPKRYEAGESFVFLGVERQLELRASVRRPRVFIEQNRLILDGEASPAERVHAVQSFYRECGRNYLRHRIDYFSKAMGLAPKKVSFRSQSTRWGSCSARGHISLNWRLIAAPAEVVDYVIIHELAHLKHHNHGPRFWALVSEFSPNYQRLKAWLRDHQWGFEFLSRKPE